MRPQTEYIITKSEVHTYAEDWLGTALRFEYQGYKCSGSILLQVLLIAAARVVSLFAACRSLADAPTDQTIRNALAATLPEMVELERRLNLALVTHMPKALRRKSRMLAIDLTLIPYHGQPAYDAKEIFRGEPKSGTTHFHAYATAVVLHKGYRYTLALTHVEYGESMKEVVQRLLAIVRRRGGKNPLSPAGQGVFQRGSDSVSSPCPLRFHHSRGRAGPEAQGSQNASARTARTAEEKEWLLSGNAHFAANQGEKENQREGQDLRLQQELYARKDRQAASKETPVRDLEGTSYSQGDPRNVSQAFRHRDQLPPDERGPNQDLHSRSTAAAAVRGHCPCSAQRVGMDSFSFRQRQIQRGTAVISRIASLPGNVVLDHPGHRTCTRRRQNPRARLPNLPTTYGELLTISQICDY